MSLNDLSKLLHRIAENQQANTAVIKQAEVISEKAWNMAQVIGDPRDARK